jgi:hypothetical protein
VTRLRRLVAVLLVAGGLWPAAATGQLAPEQAIFPEKEYRTADSRVLAQAHGQELRALYDDVRRCAPDLDFQQRGIGFWKPREVATALPHLALWVWVDPGLISWGDTTQIRAAHAFHRYARRLVPRMLARAPVREDARVEGYGLVMSWLGPDKTEGRPVGETLVVFVDKAAAVAFADGSLPGSAFLAGSRLRLFTGNAEVQPPAVVLEDWRVATPTDPSC